MRCQTRPCTSVSRRKHGRRRRWLFGGPILGIREYAAMTDIVLACLTANSLASLEEGCSEQRLPP